jgi:hypothetical protein
MTTIYNVYDQLSQILARMDSKSISELKITQPLQKRFDILVEKSKNKELSDIEHDELYHYIALERLMRMAKIRAAQKAQ